MIDDRCHNHNPDEVILSKKTEEFQYGKNTSRSDIRQICQTAYKFNV